MGDAVAKIRASRGNQQPQVGVDRLIVRIADRQRSLITLEQLTALGLSSDSIERRVRRGWLVRVHQGVYAVGRVELDAYARWQAATLACGPGALLSHLSAAGLWGIWPQQYGQAHVTVAGNGRRGHRRVAVHRMRRMHPDDAHRLDGIPVTSIELTCLQLGALNVSTDSYGRAVVKAARRREFRVAAALALCERSFRRPGVHASRRIVERDLVAELRALSELELRFVAVIQHHGIPLPQINHDIEAFMVDAVWHEQKLIVELDGFEFHKLPRDLRRDNARTRQFVLAGYRVIRFVWEDIVRDAAGTAETVRALLNR